MGECIIIDFASGERIKGKNDHSVFFALLRKMPGSPSKEDLVSTASNGQTESLTELYEYYPNEYDRLLLTMRKIVNEKNELQPYTYSKQYQKRTENVPDEVRKKRSELLKACAEYGISDQGDGSFWRDINRFLENPKIAGKPIYKMDEEEEIQAVIKRIKTLVYKREKGRDYNEKMKDKT
jgi:hypothetical protein